MTLYRPATYRALQDEETGALILGENEQPLTLEQAEELLDELDNRTK